MPELEYDKGLDPEEVIRNRKEHGSNALDFQEERVFWHALREVATEPMFVLLLAACLVYFIVGYRQEGFIMLVSILIVSGISLFQDYRSRSAVESLKKMSASRVTVIRTGKKEIIPVDDLVVDDLLLIEEGELVPADGLIVSSNDFSLNESVLTGESLSVYKSAGNNNMAYRGTLVSSGTAMLRVTAVGTKTMFGKIGLSMKEIAVVKTPLQKQIRSFVRNMVWLGALAFLIVIAYNYYLSGDWVHSFFQGLTLAMSILPEEIPVAFSTFQALGAFRLLKNQIIVKQPQFVETLGSATVICTDKTGTLTENRMSIDFLYDARTDQSVVLTEKDKLPLELIEYAMWSSEKEPFDPMEKAIHALYGSSAGEDKRPAYEQIHEYPIGGRPPMMTHIFRNREGHTVIAAKGAPEAILNLADLSPERKESLEKQSQQYAGQGYRVLGVGKARIDSDQWPAEQQEFVFEFLGLVAFHDPPKEHIADTIKTFREAGIQVKMITGDYSETAVAIARQVGLDGQTELLTGQEVLHLSTEALKQKVGKVHIYARMFPEAKLRVIDALKENGEVVAMTGDGVNDGPALKAAHIGIAMGKRGSEVARNAASLILTDDDLSHMTDAVALGRKIYDNLKRAIQYIVSIHIPIILIVTVPLIAGWSFTDIFTPVHVIFLELIMGPTCSIIYENEPMEPGTMQRPPRKMGNTFLSFGQLSVSILQGLVITAGCLGAGYYFLQHAATDQTVRTVIFISLLISNIFLTLVNRSFRYSILQTIRYKNWMVPMIIMVTLVFLVIFLYVPFVRDIFGLVTLSGNLFLWCLLTGFASTVWMEIWKRYRK